MQFCFSKFWSYGQHSTMEGKYTTSSIHKIAYNEISW
jgi:hypothetical protein